VICALDLLLSEPDNIDDEANPKVEDYTAPMGVSIDFPRRRTLAENGSDEPPQLAIHPN